MRILEFALLGIVAAAAVATYFFDPSSDPFFPPCPTNLLTDLYCPGCGTLRALHALTHGDFRAAFSQNALAMVLLPIAAVGTLAPKLLTIPYLSQAIFYSTIIFTILRNTEAFAFLAPY